MKLVFGLAVVLCVLWLGALIGWIYAHATVANECRRLGGFYVGKSTFRCTEIME